ncbi:MAG: arylsulfatase [Planctomycetota bacterium]
MMFRSAITRRLLLALSGLIPVFVCGLIANRGASAAERPNVVIMITDDQGYGDCGFTGNPIIKTPNIDQLASESTSLTDYHVAPTCSPTRSAFLTGHWTNRTGVWHTIMGRSMLRDDEITMGTLFGSGGYRTGMFGKWHLGDNYPYRPEDRGFDEVLRHGGGGVGQTPDYWDNAYFDGTYFRNSEPEKVSGFCTDVFFDAGMDFIRDCAERKVPFLTYIATNAPHGPMHAPEEYMAMYEGQPGRIPAFYGMITNIDDNVGRLRQLLEELKIADNTIVIFTTDNGSSSGSQIYNADMRGAKGSEYDGGHRVPFLVHWPGGGMDQKHEESTLCHAVDVVPTLLDICGIAPPQTLKFDGRSVQSLWDPDQDVPSLFEGRILVTDSQRVRDPIKWRKSSVMQGKWRLINGKQLYNIVADPGQQKDVAGEHPDRVSTLTAFYDAWWTELEPTFAKTTSIAIGHPKSPRVTLTAHDWIQKAAPPWNQRSIRAGQGAVARGKAKPQKKHEGHWAIRVHQAGSYRVTVRRWPEETNQPINALLAAGDEVPGKDKAFRTEPGAAIAAETAVVIVDGQELASSPVEANAASVSFTISLAEGAHELAPVFRGDAVEVGAYYCYVEPAP